MLSVDIILGPELMEKYKKYGGLGFIVERSTKSDCENEDFDINDLYEDEDDLLKNFFHPLTPKDKKDK